MNIDHKLKIDSYKLFTSLILLEAKFSLYQSSKVLHISQQKGLISETNIVSYYLIRTQLWENLQLFLQFCKAHNKQYIKMMNPQKFQTFLIKSPLFKPVHIDTELLETMKMNILELKVL